MKKIAIFMLVCLSMFCGYFLDKNMNVFAMEHNELDVESQSVLPDLVVYQAPGNSNADLYLNSAVFITTFHEDPFLMGYNTITVLALGIEEGYYTLLSMTFTEYGLFFSSYSGLSLEWYLGMTGECFDAAVFTTPYNNKVFVGEPHVIQVIASVR